MARDYRRCFQCNRLRRVEWFARRYGKRIGCKCGSNRMVEPFEVKLLERVGIILGLI